MAALSRCGINIRGRSSILRLNYRTTEEIRRSAFSIIEKVEFDDLDGGAADKKSCRSLTHGVKPEARSFASLDDEADFIVGEIRRLEDEGARPSEICVVARTNELVGRYADKIKAADIPVAQLGTGKTDKSRGEKVRAATMHRVKGLEFRHMFVAGVGERFMPLKAAVSRRDPVARRRAEISEKCLLYVAMTRAQKTVHITSFGEPSEFLKPLAGQR